jgi:hypothetical protein
MQEIEKFDFFEGGNLNENLSLKIVVCWKKHLFD